jgi:hypothetical protein
LSKLPTSIFHDLEAAVDQVLAAAVHGLVERPAVRAPVRAENQQHLLVIGLRRGECVVHVDRGIGLLVVRPGRCVSQHAHRRGRDQEQDSFHEVSLNGYRTFYAELTARAQTCG